MATVDRRNFLKLMGAPAVTAALPGHLAEALAIPAHHRTGSIQDVEHVIILMQENRSFDHYFGTMRGVRGFADPRAVRLPSGKPVWFQPDGQGGEVLPFRPAVPDLGQSFLPDPPHGWTDTHAAWDGGWQDQFVPNKGVTAMTYHTRSDLPYQFALADAFTVCDHYHCSVMGPTDPNRYHMWTGWVGNDGSGGGPVITNAEAGYDWSTYPERLEHAGISWKVYQDRGVGLDSAGLWGFTEDPFIGNYGDNSLLYFHQYQNARPGNPLADKAKTGTNIRAQNREPERLMDVFRRDVRNGTLPQVTWIVAPEAYTEHPNWPPDFGAWYVSQFIDILASNPDVWSKMALFVTYDEEGGFFDHMVPPTPPARASQGRSTASTLNEIYPGDPDHPTGPYGLGMRVPMLIVSPWTRGGWVNSQVFDHTSLIQFLERRFAGGNPDLIETNITPWRRAVVGDLTTAFDFENPNRSTRLRLPNTDAFEPVDMTRQPDQVPVPPDHQQVPTQERGVRAARAIPYVLTADGHRRGRSFVIQLGSLGQATGVFQVRSGDGSTDPRVYTVEPQRQLTDSWPLDADGAYDLAVHGPNGFFREFKGSDESLEVSAAYDTRRDKIHLTLTNHGPGRVTVAITDAYAGHSSTVRLGPGESSVETRSLGRTHGWYDVAVTIQGVAGYLHQFAGHVENGKASISDPLMGGLVHGHRPGGPHTPHPSDDDRSVASGTH